jgi:C-terminal processing protease CtpA/Prc
VHNFERQDLEAAAVRPLCAASLGLFYLPIRAADGTFQLRLVSDPIAGSPASTLQLDAGDMIIALDGLPFRNANDVLNHFDRTTVDYIDSATKTRRKGIIDLPSQNP